MIQEKFRNGKDKIDLKEESTYDYLVMLSNTAWRIEPVGVAVARA